MEIDNKLEVDVEFSIISDACSIITLAGKSSVWRFTVPLVGGESYGCSGSVRNRRVRINGESPIMVYPEKKNQLFQLELTSKLLLGRDYLKFRSLFSAHIAKIWSKVTRQYLFTKNYRENIVVTFFLWFCWFWVWSTRRCRLGQKADC